MWFIDEVWPLVKSKMPQVKLYLAGRGLTPDFLEVTDDSIVVVGEVESASAFMKSHDIMVVPLLTAGGIRVKTIEAMALAKAVVTTSIGLEGIDAEHGNQVICEDEPEAMAASIVALIQHPDRILQLGNQARNLVESHFDNKRIIDKLVSFYESIGKP
jgi:glycosyltransferase involved in cell wall biosynthesis